MKYAIIENNKIVNIAVSDVALGANWVELQNGFGIGDNYINEVFSKPIRPLEELKTEAIAKVKASSTAMSPVTINDITYNGGDSSASAISGAMQLAQNLGETDVKLWDVNNTIRTYTFEETQLIAAQIAKAYRDAKYSDYVKIEAINACTTVAELEAIEI